MPRCGPGSPGTAALTHGAVGPRGGRSVIARCRAARGLPASSVSYRVVSSGRPAFPRRGRRAQHGGAPASRGLDLHCSACCNSYPGRSRALVPVPPAPPLSALPGPPLPAAGAAAPAPRSPFPHAAALRVSAAPPFASPCVTYRVARGGLPRGVRPLGLRIARTPPAAGRPPGGPSAADGGRPGSRGLVPRRPGPRLPGRDGIVLLRGGTPPEGAARVMPLRIQGGGGAIC